MDGRQWKDAEISDLRVIKSEEFRDDDGETLYCIYSFSIDAVTFVEKDILRLLQKRGIQKLDNLPPVS